MERGKAPSMTVSVCWRKHHRQDEGRTSTKHSLIYSFKHQRNGISQFWIRLKRWKKKSIFKRWNGTEINEALLCVLHNVWSQSFWCKKKKSCRYKRFVFFHKCVWSKTRLNIFGLTFTNVFFFSFIKDLSVKVTSQASKFSFGWF